MVKVVGVVFKNKGRIYYFSPNYLDLKLNDAVIVETEKGLQFGNIKMNEKDIPNDQIKGSLKKVIKKASKKDIKFNETNEKEERRAIYKCQKIANSYDLKMKIIDAHYTFDRYKLVFKFVADNRIDFRELAKKLASIYKTRIELMQVGVRDKAKEIGGYGQCGRQLCCHKFLNDIESVSISMAKNQNIALNPTKINGVCGRLLCCLKYEDECYKDLRQGLPKVGKKVQTEQGEGKVISIDVLKGTYRVNIPEVGIVELEKEKNEG